jgi:hypothetical protein
LPFGMPGIGEVIEGAMQQAPQPGRQFIADYSLRRSRAGLGGGPPVPPPFKIEAWPMRCAPAA